MSDTLLTFHTLLYRDLQLHVSSMHTALGILMLI